MLCRDNQNICSHQQAYLIALEVEITYKKDFELRVHCYRSLSNKSVLPRTRDLLPTLSVHKFYKTKMLVVTLRCFRVALKYSSDRWLVRYKLFLASTVKSGKVRRTNSYAVGAGHYLAYSLFYDC